MANWMSLFAFCVWFWRTPQMMFDIPGLCSCIKTNQVKKISATTTKKKKKRVRKRPQDNEVRAPPHLLIGDGDVVVEKCAQRNRVEVAVSEFAVEGKGQVLEKQDARYADLRHRSRELQKPHKGIRKYTASKNAGCWVSCVAPQIQTQTHTHARAHDKRRTCSW